MGYVVRFPIPRSRRRAAAGGIAGGGRRIYNSAKVSPQVETIVEGRAPFFVGEWLVEPTLNRLSNGGEAVQLELKAMDVLVCLAVRAGELVGKTELLDAVWETEFVSDNTLTRRIAQLRDALGDDARDPRYIETITKRGYRLIARVTPVEVSTAEVTGFPERTVEADAEESCPYPGLSAFSEADAEDFFGREREIAELWRKITSRRLLAVIGPSGVGKSSLLKAGVIPGAPDGWRAVSCQPGDTPFLSLARALAPDFAGEVGDVRQLLGFADPDVALAMVSRWRGQWAEAVVVIDQFEELFTLNPAAVQDAFVALLRRLVDAADVHLVLVLRDDFLYECHRYKELGPILKDLTLVGPLAGAELRRAVVEPAASRLYGFESALLVDEMLDEVVEERGALPLLAFAVSRLWQLRDRERRLLTREAYEEIGGVGGALAQHAEAMVEEIGAERLPVVRELFRNLVTAKGTRASRESADVLSVFPDHEREGASEVLNALIDARLLTSYQDEVGEGEDRTAVHRVEIVHESLLAAWPRLVRWQTRDADASQLRDQLRQAAALWEEKGRPQDLLWTGPSYREFLVWREAYPGGVSAVEGAFADAMTVHSGRRRRRRRLAAVALLVALSAVAIGMTALWQRAEHQARRVEARRLQGIGRRVVDTSPPAALAWALASLQMEDDPGTRRIALTALWRSPMPRVLDVVDMENLFTVAMFSPDGRWMASGFFDGTVGLWSSSGDFHGSWKAHSGPMGAGFSPDSRVMVSNGWGDAHTSIWSVPDGRRLRDLPGYDEWAATDADLGDSMGLWRMHRFVADPGVEGGWSLDPRPVELRRRLQQGFPPRAALGPDGRSLLYAIGSELLLADVDRPDAEPRPIATCGAEVKQIEFSPDGTQFATTTVDGDIAVWSFTDDAPQRIRSWSGPANFVCNGLQFDPSGRFVAVIYDEGHAVIHGLDDPPGADGLRLDPDGNRLNSLFFHPSGDWLVTASLTRIAVWPFDRSRHPFVLRGHSGPVEEIAYGPHGDFVVSLGTDGTVRHWPLRPGPGAEPRVVFDWGHPIQSVVGSLDLSADGTVVATTGGEGSVRVIPLNGSPQRFVAGADQRLLRVAVSADGRLVAAPGRFDNRHAVQIWDLETGGVREFDLPEGYDKIDSFFTDVGFTRDGDLLISLGGRGMRLNPSTGEFTDAFDGSADFALDGEGRTLIGRPHADGSGGSATIQDLITGTSTTLDSHGSGVYAFDIDPSGTIVVTAESGKVQVGRITGESPHTLTMDWSGAGCVAVSPDGRWIASGHLDGAIRLWPMPDLDAPSTLDLPHRELLARLKSLTNLRAIPDPDQPPGWYFVKATEPFRGWEDAPPVW